MPGGKGVSMRRRKKKPSTSNVVLLALGAFLLVFIAAMTITFWRMGSVPDTLIQYTLGAGGVEAVAMAGIKIGKTLAGEKEPEE